LIDQGSGAAIGERLLACVDEQGSAAHPYLRARRCCEGRTRRAIFPTPSTSCACCTAATRASSIMPPVAASIPSARLVQQATSAFAEERAFLTRLCLMPPARSRARRRGDTESTVLGQRHAIEMLAQSERNGCALGAAVA
jgi:hypothetical protein